MLLVGSVVLLLAVASAKIGTRVGLPALLIFLGLGLALGDAGIGVDFHDAGLARSLGFAALVIILAEGGLTTRWETIKPAALPALVLATLGVAISISLMAVFGHFVLGMQWSVAVLFGAILSPTDSAAVFSVLRRVPIPPRVAAILEGESGLNDAPVVLLVSIATSATLGQGGATDVGQVIVNVAVELVAGCAVGIAVGVIGRLLLKSVALPAIGLYPLAVLGWCLLSYGLAVWLGLSGFAAVYLCALLLGNSHLPHRTATRSFVEGIGWVAQIGLFVMLGLLASPARITVSTVMLALGCGAFLTFIARPLTVAACLAPFRVPVREQAFVAWAGLRGAVPVILATVPLAAGYWRGETIFDMVFVFVVAFTVLQAPTLPWVARRLGLVGTIEANEIDVESAPLAKVQAELMHVKVPAESQLSGVSIQELHLPKNVVVSLIVRGGETFVPQPHELIRRGDQLLIVAPGTSRVRVERRMRDIDANGRLARWHRPNETAKVWRVRRRLPSE